MATLQANDVGFCYGTRRVLHNVNLMLEPGVTALVGPNAAGKSTLLKCLCGQLSPKGEITLDGQSLRGLSRRDLSRQIGYLPQTQMQRSRFTVFETILLGRLHELGWRASQSEIERVHDVLEETSLTSLADRETSELSGGQIQMVAIAQALVREPSVLLLDEPTSNLDLRRQLEVCSRIRHLTAARGVCTLMAMHDLNLAARYADHVLVLREGTPYANGTPAQVLTETMLEEVYQVAAQVTLGANGHPSIVIQGPSDESGEI